MFTSTYILYVHEVHFVLFNVHASNNILVDQQSALFSSFAHLQMHDIAYNILSIIIIGINTEYIYTLHTHNTQNKNQKQ